jgi:diaminopimelate epimerase
MVETAPALRAAAAFYRAHGLGNDYLVFEVRPGVAGEHEEAAWPVSAATVRAVCHRWTGMGSDGIVVLTDPTAGEPFPLRMFNPDGSEFERSGNGLRILASHLRRTGRVGDEPFQVRSGGSLIGMQVHRVEEGGVHDVSVEMGRAQPSARAVGLEIPEGSLDNHAGAVTFAEAPGGSVTVHPVSVGNPHAVVFTEDLSEAALSALGPFLAGHPSFSHGTNVQLARVEGPHRLRIAIWERGVGRTSASGTSSCAATVAAVHTGRLEPGTVRVEMEGGSLTVQVNRDLEVVLRGPVQEVATGELTGGFLAGLSRLG